MRDEADLDRYLPLFVYGTLRPGMLNHDRFLKGRFERIDPASVSGALHLVEAENYPYLLPGAGTVIGDLIYLKPETFLRTIGEIDRLEDFCPDDDRGSLYVRRRCCAVIDAGIRVEAWTYFWNDTTRPGRIIPSGDFCRKAPGA